jgi:hypothetical protein
MRYIFPILFTILLIPNELYAEVSDKVPSIARVWLTGIFLGTIGFAAATYRKWAAIVAGIISLTFCYVHFSVISDPFVGKAIVKEQGSKYVLSVYGSITAMLLPVLVGFFLRKKTKKDYKNT